MGALSIISPNTMNSYARQYIPNGRVEELQMHVNGSVVQYLDYKSPRTLAEYDSIAERIISPTTT
jgi:hypothetical protein